MVIVGIILFTLGAIVICVSVNGSFAGLFGTLLVSMGTAIMIAFIDADSPSAIDVYRGKTTLKITSVNDVPTDSAVVYKKK
jgi:hypothetical protein